MSAPSIEVAGVPTSALTVSIVGEASGAGAAPQAPAPDAPSNGVASMIALRFALFAGMVSCGVAVAVTGRWNAVAILQVLFLLGFFATYQNIRAAVADVLAR